MDNRKQDAAKLVRYHAYAGAGTGLIPVPGLDVAALTGTQINLLHKLCKLYDVPFSTEQARGLIAALIGGVAPAAIGTGMVGSLVKAVPFFGTVMGIAIMPALSWASTTAVGHVFIQHFETGGTLLDFNADKMRDFYNQQLAKARAEAPADLGNDKAA